MKTLYDTDLEVITCLDERYYFKDGIYSPSVTTVLDVYPKGFGFQQWLKDLGHNSEEVLRRAAERGSRVHAALEKIATGGAVRWEVDGVFEFSLDEWKMINKGVEFLKEFVAEIDAVEISIVSGGVGGTIDLICRIGGEVWLIDWKTGNGIYPSHHIQAAKYANMYGNETGMNIPHVGILHLNAKTRGPGRGGAIQGAGWQLIEVEDRERKLELFDHVFEIWKAENPNAQPKNLTYPGVLKLK